MVVAARGEVILMFAVKFFGQVGASAFGDGGWTMGCAGEDVAAQDDG